MLTQATPFESELAERSVIGCILFEPSTALNMALRKECCEDWFHNARLRAIWNCALELHRTGQKIDSVTMSDLLTRKFRNEEFLSELEACYDSYITIAHMESYLVCIQDKYIKRKLRSIYLAELDNLPGLTAEEALSESKFALSKLHMNDITKRQRDQIIADCKTKFVNARQGICPNLPVRFPSLHKMLNGLRLGKTSIIAARPGLGKTTIGTNLITYLGEQGIPSAISSVEMQEDELTDRMIGDIGNVDIFKMDNGDYLDSDMKAYEKAAAKFMKYPIYINDSSVTIESICAWIQDQKAEHDIQVCMIDYLQIVTSSSKYRGTRNEEIGYYSQSIINLAKKLNIHILLLSQLTRVAASEIPQLHHLRDSGAIEQDAYNVVFIYQDPSTLSEPWHDDVPVYADAAKNRGGPTGRVPLRFRKTKQKFIDPIVYANSKAKEQATNEVPKF